MSHLPLRTAQRTTAGLKVTPDGIPSMTMITLRESQADKLPNNGRNITPDFLIRLEAESISISYPKIFHPETYIQAKHGYKYIDR